MTKAKIRQKGLRKDLPNTLQAYWETLTPHAKREFCAKAHRTYNYVCQRVWDDRNRISPQLAMQLEIASLGRVRCEDMCPDFNWQYARHRYFLPRDVAKAKREGLIKKRGR